MRYLSFPLTALGLALLTLSCSSSIASKSVSHIVIRPSDTTLTLGQTAQLSGSGLDANNDLVTTSLNWSSSNTSVLNVDGTGHISALAPGSATVTGSVNGVSGTSVVTVIPPVNAPTIALGTTGVTFSAAPGDSNPAAQTVDVTNSGGGTLSGLGIGSIAYGPGASGWLAASMSPTTAPAAVTLTATLGSLAPGTYQATVPVTSSASGVTNSPQTIAVTFTVKGAMIVVNNLLIEPVTVYANGVSLGTVSAQGTGSTFTTDSPLTVSYSLIQPTTTQGVAVGEAMSGVFTTIPNPTGKITFTINNVIGSQPYFAPLITNNGANPILMAVNWGLAAENRCNCEVPAGGTNVHIGYYRLFSNTEVTGFGVSSGYGNGVYTYWLYSNFGASIASGSGAVSLINNATLTNRVAGAGAVSGQFRAVPPTARVSVAGPVYDHAMPNPLRQ